jgi:ABC-2 type transport system permease protein
MRYARSILSAYLTLLRIGFAEILAYRAQVLVWILTSTMPLVNLALWHSVARGKTIGRFGRPEIVAYFLATFIVHQLTGTSVAWVLGQEIRSGNFSMRLLRPIHPMLVYSAENLSATPIRAILSIPVAVIALIFAGDQLARDSFLWFAAFWAVFGAWLINFLVMSVLGSLAFFLESSRSFMYAWQALSMALSGYLFPLDFLSLGLPQGPTILRHLPFYYISGFPIELMLGLHDRITALRGLGIAYAYVLALLLFGQLVWRAGLRRWNAYGA